MPEFPIKNDQVSGAVELGPRSLALLRRIALSLEMLLDEEVPDPGKPFEDEDQTWPAADA